MTSIHRRLFSTLAGIILALIIVQLLNWSESVQAQTTSLNVQSQQSVPNSVTSYSFYGSNHSWMYTATNDWYQHRGNWCGIANVRAISARMTFSVIVPS